MAGILTSAVVVTVCLLASCCGRLLKTGEIGYRASPGPPPLLHHVQATDGRSAIFATVSGDQGLITCRVHNSTDAVSKVLDGPNVTVKFIGEGEIQATWSRCFLKDPSHAKLSATLGQTHTQPAGYVRQARAAATTPNYSGLPFPPDFQTGTPAGPGSSIAIVPGTKWCGKGNVAKSYDDLGEHNLTDSCCRTHDHCPYYIPAITTKYHYRNLKPWTLSYCDCDHTLYNCLKRVSNENFNIVGNLFFGALKVQCFDFGKGNYCVRYYLTHLWCEEYSTGPMAVTHNSPFHW